ncbi:uncharacterized protein BDZ83DRAFT_627517 [Colletotrichum acutatum]|uniref:Uncharacterized protein n=1 Tax=Glomerella acutata TaxID=27357 RepID=A0AAD8UFL2_GLOAC|nr:uncharacterized protein BDZ83DRAFT_627517 [Colletotrichum acutatum]KAK1723021.1 hypothetical protein BDZ83DRAFT_627517 [Colletotrichum acutatum]
MSGLEGIAGLSLACNVMQLIRFGHEAISMCRRVYESGSPEPSLSEHAESLKAVCDSLEKSLDKRPILAAAAAAAPTAATIRAPTMEKRILELTAKCIKNARDLEEEMKFLSPNPSGKLGALVAAPKILWRKRRLERLKGDLDDAQRLIDTSILERLLARAEALYKMNEKGFLDLSQELKQFITDYAKSGSILRTVVETHTKQIQDHVTAESSKTQDAIKSHVSLKLSSHEISIKNHVSSSAQDVQHALSQRMTSREDSKANESSDVHTTSIQSGESVEPLGNSRTSTRSLRPTEPRPWDSLVDWLKDDTRKVYWIRGKPGSGKSILMNTSKQMTTLLDWQGRKRGLGRRLGRGGR